MELNTAKGTTRFTILDIFGADELQRIQDAFSNATGLASLITSPDGTPITRESNFSELCLLIRSTKKGLRNCKASDALLGSMGSSGPAFSPCLSCGIWDAGTPIIVGGIHIANWLIGQVRSEETDCEQILAYAKEIDAPAEPYRKAFADIPVMPLERFRKIVRSLDTIAGDLSRRAYNQVKQHELFREWTRSLKALESSEAHNRALLAALPDLTIILDRKGNIVDLREGDETRALHRPDAAVSRHCSEVLPSWLSDLTTEKLAILYQTGMMQEYEYSLESEDGERQYESRLVRCGNDQALAIIRDVTTTRKAFEELQGSLCEKELLLRELFHRTKNNMQLTRSLLSLQANYAGDSKVSEALRSAESRILSMDLVHTHLHLSRDLSRIRLDHYLQELILRLNEHIPVQGERVRYALTCPEISVLIDIASPLGLIVNELVSNSLRHAFPETYQGEITLIVEETEDTGIRIIYRDNGVGPQSSFSLEKADTLGLLTVRMLISQLGGSISAAADPGLCYTMELKTDGYRERV